MVRHWWRIAGVATLAAAALLFAAGPSLAAGHGGGGHGGGGHGGGGHAGGAVAHGGSFSHGGSVSHGGYYHSGYHNGGYHNGGYHNGGYHNGYHHDHDRFFFGIGLGFGYPFYGGYYPWYSPGYYGGGYYGDYYGGGYSGDYATAAYVPGTYAYTGSPNTYSTPSAVAGPGASAVPDENAIYVRVQVPANAEVWFEGQKTTQTGPVRFFESPPLTPGRNYVYHIRARWTENGHEVNQTRDAQVYAGDKFSIDFTKMQRTQQREKVPAPKEKAPQ